MLITLSLIGLMVLVPVWGVAHYLHWFSDYELPPIEEAELPNAAIILAARGASPTLNECLTRLAGQDYPRYQVYAVIDHPTDPANAIIQEWSAKNPGTSLEISYLENPLSNAYLKTSAVMQCIGSLPDNVGAVVLADADTLTYPTWLRDLIRPLLVEGVGLVTGNRWYDPTVHSVGGLTRFFYNTLCVPPMYFIRATWGGSLAIKRSLFNTESYHDGIADSFSEEVIFQKLTRHAGLSIEVQPDVMILNQESCSLSAVFNFMKRQLLWTRLYHPGWIPLLIGLSLVYIVFTGFLCVGVCGLISGYGRLGGIMLGGLVLEIISCQILSEWLHRSISRRALKVQGIEFPKIDWPARCRMLGVLPVSFVIISYAMFAAAIAKRVKWSGITYEVIPPDGIHMLEYLTMNEVSKTP
ncbi:glycosyltransferase [Bythopirellula goksoeyrii]|uniref:Glycosyl transferase family 2 n=1 Tax=Bythopirellula goksoeyrii TaxID=1400387 RepID=A0A5B9Q7G8_9BACT|nr:glycosyltransferase family 2 protein [Bythopirellula goksoeyrii]QEG34974.1 Glycosyl transferase family 2 [Bythopirellula goksoeyrii]